MNIQINRRESILILTLGMLLILVLGFRLLVLPAYDSWMTRSAQIAALELARPRTTDTTASDGVDTAEADINLAALFLPKSTPEEFHRYFQQFVTAGGLTLESISISESDEYDSTGFSKTAVNLSMSGTQAQFMRFLEEIENSDRAIVVNSMSISPGDGRDVRFNVGLTAYCVENSDESLDFVPAAPKAANGFRLAQASGMNGESR